jgi:hypothetical protein
MKKSISAIWLLISVAMLFGCRTYFINNTEPEDSTSNKKAAPTLPKEWTSTPEKIPTILNQEQIQSGETPATDPGQPTQAGIPEAATKAETATPIYKATFTPLPTLQPTLSIGYPDEPEGVLAAAWNAYLDRDEETLKTFYGPMGQEVCELAFDSYLNCMGAAYSVRGLTEPEGWYILSLPRYTEKAVTLFLVTAWSDSDAEWQHMFDMYRIDGQWKIDDPQTIVYESAQ